MRYVPNGTGFCSVSRPSHTSSYRPAGRVARVMEWSWFLVFLTRFHIVERSGWYFGSMPQNASTRTSLPEESSTQTATYGRFLERPDVSGRVTMSWYPCGQLVCTGV